MRSLRTRMPVIVLADLEDRWLDPELRDPETLSAVLAPCSADQMAHYVVSTAGNNPANDDPECVRPADAVIRPSQD